MKVWRETEFNNHYFFDENDGKIIGQVHKLGTQGVVYVAKIFYNANDKVLGQFIEAHFAKSAVENFWLMEERTLTHG